ncbi:MULTISPECIES: DUF2157 domain-containing protein [Streptomyces]|uniref:DUF2157 domain-containing protein n=1 Tax=Streptomyces venezuelae TaxID=54571 RepID=A0A5P2BFK6_STRVZ|nr:DUF2157 domain-containing protein [Streptomyces venezuelae]MYY81956.1 hypothetical protein [Streptomyces sp. SID335]MYZ18556.1 hypothetical protein [Streptomyces sp. SID337]NDZ84302.1 DUF2157 domain-containing protein [Streptomyces sp. SID10115]NEB49280.1 DUF2157 domain-containing protein [Streptomyces sp. SID339]QES27911.1 hypothetical protein DEJ47_16990 [Streptomyces venezuelae]
MGIESDQLVYDYLSRVGDLAQQRQLPSGDRMRLVADLRNRIDRGRGGATGDSPASVRRILARLGTPEEVVEAAGGTSGDAASDVPGHTPGTTPGHTPGHAPGDVPAKPRALRVPKPRRPARRAPRTQGATETTETTQAAQVPDPRRAPDLFEGAAPPHLAGVDELGPSDAQPDWWRVDSSPFGHADSVPGFVGGIEIPELLKPPAKAGAGARKAVEDEEAAEEEEEGEEEAAYEEAVEEPGRRRWRLPRVRTGADTGPTFSNPLLLLAAALLTVGAVLGNLVVLGVGWLIAYASRRLTRAEVKFAVIGLPVLAVAAGITWLWGRSDGRWGDPVRDGHMSDAIADTWPWVVRGAAVASALFLLWRSQRQRP